MIIAKCCADRKLQNYIVPWSSVFLPFRELNRGGPGKLYPVRLCCILSKSNNIIFQNIKIINLGNSVKCDDLQRYVVMPFKLHFDGYIWYSGHCDCTNACSNRIQKIPFEPSGVMASVTNGSTNSIWLYLTHTKEENQKGK